MHERLTGKHGGTLGGAFRNEEARRPHLCVLIGDGIHPDLERALGVRLRILAGAALAVGAHNEVGEEVGLIEQVLAV